MFCCPITTVDLRTFVQRMPLGPAKGWSRQTSFWCLCVTAAIAFVISSALSMLSAGFTIRILFALFAIMTTTAVQKFIVLEFVVIFLRRKRSICAIVLEAILSNWTESALAVIAAWKGRGAIVPAFLVGAVAMNHLLLLGVCFIHGGHYSSEIKYPVLMTPIHTRILPAGLALSTYAAFSTARSGAAQDANTRIHVVTAVLLLLLFTGHLVFVCQLHSTYSQQALGLHRLFKIIPVGQRCFEQRKGEDINPDRQKEPSPYDHSTMQMEDLSQLSSSVNLRQDQQAWRVRALEARCDWLEAENTDISTKLQEIEVRDMEKIDDSKVSAIGPSGGIGGRIDVSMASRLNFQREKWLSDRLLRSHASNQEANSCKPWDSARAAVLLLLTCSANLSLCIQLVGSLAPDDATTWQSPLRLGYVFVPISTGVAGLIAIQLHNQWCVSVLEPGQVMYNAALSTFHLLYFTLPAFVLARWTTAPTQPIEFLGGFQVAILGITMLLPLYAMHTGSDNWLIGTALLALYVLYANCVW